MSNKEGGLIYILISPSYPDYVKIGYTKNLEYRLKQLNRSETLPYSFHPYATYETDHELTDKVLHSLIDKLNPTLRTTEVVNGKKRTKEFFEMTPEDAYDILDAIARISGTESRLHRFKDKKEETPGGEKDAEKKKRRPSFKFSMVGLPVGTELHFLKDDSIKCKVADDKSKVECLGKTWSLSGLAAHLLGYKAAQGPDYFTFQGEKLTDMRDRIEENNNHSNFVS